MKKVLFVIQSLHVGGAEREQITLANALANKGYNVTILMVTPLNDYKNELDSRIKLIYKAPDRHIGNKIPYIRYKYYDDCMWELRATPEQLHRYYVGRKKYDVEIAFFHGLAVKIVAGSKNKNALKLAWIHHDLQRLAVVMPKDWDELRRLYHRYDKIVCVSEFAKNSFIETIGSDCSVSTIYNLLPIAEIKEKAEQKPERTVKRAALNLVLVARFNKTKGYGRLFRSIANLRKTGRFISLAYIGAGKRAPIDELIEELKAEDYISVIEGKDNPYPYIKNADLLVCASFTEGYNLTVAEALVLGIPVLSTDCEGPREILDNGKYGMLVENSEQGLYDGLLRLYDNPHLLEGYKKMTAERMDFFDEERILGQITALFEKG